MVHYGRFDKDLGLTGYRCRTYFTYLLNYLLCGLTSALASMIAGFGLGFLHFKIPASKLRVYCKARFDKIVSYV